MILFLFILGYSFHLGRSLSRNKEDLFIRAVGIGGASATVCYSIICILGSRAVNLEFTSYFWTYLVCMQVIDMKLRQRASDAKPKKRRTNAYEARDTNSPEVSQVISSSESTQAESEESAQSLVPLVMGQRKRKRSHLSMADAREKRRRLRHYKR